jgi:uncharacterized membrane protein YoaK (UPF0700 family)
LRFRSGQARGAVDAIAYLQFDHVFVANMTGNTILFASNLVFHHVSAAIAHLLPILGFLAGVVVARLLLNRNPPKQDSLGPSPASGLCFLLASGLWTIIGVLTPSLTSFLIPVLAFSMGAQNAAFTRVGKTPVNTAFITGDLEKFGEAIANLVSFQKADGLNERTRIRAVGCIWIAYAIGAALGALFGQPWGKRALLFPAGVLFLSAGLAFVFLYREKK